MYNLSVVIQPALAPAYTFTDEGILFPLRSVSGGTVTDGKWI